jgi:hypothetical protein
MRLTQLLGRKMASPNNKYQTWLALNASLAGTPEYQIVAQAAALADPWGKVREEKDIQASSLLPNTFSAFAFSERPYASNDRSETVLWTKIA